VAVVSAVQDDCGRRLPAIKLVVCIFCKKSSNVFSFQFLLGNFLLSLLAEIFFILAGFGENFIFITQRISFYCIVVFHRRCMLACAMLDLVFQYHTNRLIGWEELLCSDPKP